MKVSLQASDNLFLGSPRPRRRLPPRGRSGESPSRVSRCTHGPRNVLAGLALVFLCEPRVPLLGPA